jgi:hypothetical protein
MIVYNIPLLYQTLFIGYLSITENNNLIRVYTMICSNFADCVTWHSQIMVLFNKSPRLIAG